MSFSSEPPLAPCSHVTFYEISELSNFANAQMRAWKSFTWWSRGDIVKLTSHEQAQPPLRQ